MFFKFKLQFNFFRVEKLFFKVKSSLKIPKKSFSKIFSSTHNFCVCKTFFVGMNFEKTFFKTQSIVFSKTFVDTFKKTSKKDLYRIFLFLKFERIIFQRFF
jgi:hypothetical protein